MGKIGVGGSKKEKGKIVKIHFFVSGLLCHLWNSEENLAAGDAK